MSRPVFLPNSQPNPPNTNSKPPNTNWYDFFRKHVLIFASNSKTYNSFKQKQQTYENKNLCTCNYFI